MKVRKGAKSQEYVQLGLDGSLCLVLVQHALRGFLLLQLLVGSSFCFCNTVLQEHSFKGNSMILAETQPSSKHSAIYIIAQSPSQLFTDTDLQLEPSMHRSSSSPVTSQIGHLVLGR